MANKRYDQFPAGAYTATDIILQADPVTGALEKIALQDIPSGGGLALAAAIFANNSGVNPQTMATITIPANTLVTDGDFINLQLTFNCLTTASSPVINIAGFAINLATAAPTVAGNCNLFLQLVRQTSVSIFSAYSFLRQNSFAGNGAALATVADFTIANNITVTVTAGAAASLAVYSLTADINQL